ncbi:MAG: hypothetical protein MK193_09105, partial [Lentisphaeria bacterium]|nr:hypothetical protein [Lentisphaeria bacterium]
MEAYLILGPTGVGKTPLGKKLESNGIAGKKVHHFDFGKQLRVVCEYRDPLFTTAELSFLDEVLNEGRLLENDQFYIARKIFRAFQEKAEIDLDEDIVLMNGLPRH